MSACATRMDNALKLAKIVFFLSSAAFSLCAAAGLHVLAARATATVTDLDRVILSMGGTAAEVRKTSKATAAAADEQRRYWREISQRTIKTLDDADRGAATLAALLADTDRTLNAVCEERKIENGKSKMPPFSNFDFPFSGGQCREGLLPTATTLVTSNEADVQRLLVSTEATVNALAATSAQGTAALQNASKLLGDPSLPETERNLASLSAHSDALMADAQDSMHRIDQRVEQLTTPKGTVSVLAGGVWDLFKASLSGLIAILH